MGTSWRRKTRIVPGLLWLNTSWSESRGFSRSWTVKIGPWSYNTRQATSTIDLPWGFKHRHKHG